MKGRRVLITASVAAIASSVVAVSCIFWCLGRFIYYNLYFNRWEFHGEGLYENGLDYQISWLYLIIPATLIAAIAWRDFLLQVRPKSRRGFDVIGH